MPRPEIATGANQEPKEFDLGKASDGIIDRVLSAYGLKGRNIRFSWETKDDAGKISSLELTKTPQITHLEVNLSFGNGFATGHTTISVHGTTHDNRTAATELGSIAIHKDIRSKGDWDELHDDENATTAVNETLDGILPIIPDR